jgi:predicted nucleotide-binding protein
MDYYHAIIKNVSKLTKEIDVIVDRNRSEECVKEKTERYNKGEKFNLKGRLIDPEFVDFFFVIKSTETLDESDAIFICGALKEGSPFETILAGLGVEDVTELYINQQLTPRIDPISRQSESTQNRNIFIVHGRDHEPMKELKALLIDLGYNPIVLQEQAGGGSFTLVEKLEKYAKTVGYTFVILTPEDIGGHRDEMRATLGVDAPLLSRPILISPDYTNNILKEFESRARQNVIFEMGYFFALLGRKNVCCLLKGQMENPTDIDGVEYGHFNTSIIEVKDKIIKELREAYEKKERIEVLSSDCRTKGN